MLATNQDGKSATLTLRNQWASMHFPKRLTINEPWAGRSPPPARTRILNLPKRVTGTSRQDPIPSPDANSDTGRRLWRRLPCLVLTRPRASTPPFFPLFVPSAVCYFHELSRIRSRGGTISFLQISTVGLCRTISDEKREPGRDMREYGTI